MRVAQRSLWRESILLNNKSSMDEKDKLSHLQTAKQKAMKQDYEEKLYEDVKEFEKDLPLQESERIFFCCLIRDTKPPLYSTSITL